MTITMEYFNDLKPSQEVVVLMVPFPLQGHLNQFLHLSRLVSAHNMTVHYITTSAQSHQVRDRIHGSDLRSISNVVFHDVPSMQYQSPPPDPNAPIKFPSHLQPLIEATSLLREPVKELIGNLSCTSKRVVIIYDSMMGSVVQDFVNYANAETYTFHSISAFSIFFFLWEKLGRPFPIDEEKFWNVPSLDGCFTPEFLKFVANQHDHTKLNSGRIYNTCRVIESRFLEFMERPEISGEKKQWALGPFNPVNALGHERINRELTYSRGKCLKWLDSKPPNSVLFVSFGTTTSLSDKQIKELAIGLEKSEQNFMWVLREADRGDAKENPPELKGDDKLPNGFEDRVIDRGIIVRDWAPQLEILGHFATGGFLSHCGWNSCMESISMGVPIATWPMHSDQPRNAVLITKVLKIGLVTKDWENRDEMVNCLTVENAVRRLITSEEGAAMRSRAVELSGTLKSAVTDGGMSRMEMDSFISHITREECWEAGKEWQLTKSGWSHGGWRLI